MRNLKSFTVFILAYIGIHLSFVHEPLSTLGSVTLIDENYILLLNRQYFVSGFVGSVFACISAYMLRVSFPVIFVSLICAGILFVVSTQLSEPDALQYTFGAVVEFMTPFMGVSMVVILILFGINRLWRRIGETST